MINSTNQIEKEFVLSVGIKKFLMIKKKMNLGFSLSIDSCEFFIRDRGLGLSLGRIWFWVWVWVS